MLLNHSGRHMSLAALALISATVGLSANANATITLVVNIETGNMKLVGEAGDKLASYEIKTSNASELSFVTSGTSQNVTDSAHTWDKDRFGGTPDNSPSATVGGSTFTLSTSMQAGNGTWHSMGTGTITSGYTNQIGEMCAVKGVAYGAGDVRTPLIYTFTDTLTTIDLGNHFVIGSAMDLVFGYSDMPGFMNTSLFTYKDSAGVTHVNEVNPLTQTWSGSSSSNYAGQSFSGIGIGGIVEYVNNAGDILQTTITPVAAVPEPASIGLLGIAGVGMVMKRRRKIA